MCCCFFIVSPFTSPYASLPSAAASTAVCRRWDSLITTCLHCRLAPPACLFESTSDLISCLRYQITFFLRLTGKPPQPRNLPYPLPWRTGVVRNTGLTAVGKSQKGNVQIETSTQRERKHETRNFQRSRAAVGFTLHDGGDVTPWLQGGYCF